jgi:hypothetical protein
VSVKRVASSWLWFERAVEVLVPHHRRTSSYCRSHCRNSAALNNLTISQALAAIDACQSIDGVVTTMTGHGNGRRLYSLNLVNLVIPERPSTLEFRRAPATVEAEEISAWCELIMSFVLSALRVGTTSRLASFSRDVEGLRLFLDAGLDEDASLSELVFVDWLFEGKEGWLEPLECVV